MTRALFVSDIHLRSALDPKYELFQRFLDACFRKKIDQLFLVGDIFDLWVADRRYFVEAYPDVIEKLKNLRATGTHIHYFEGNHDLDLRPFWQHHLGFDVHSEAAFFVLNGRTFRIEHGDQMDPTDRGYLFLRWLLRTPLLVFLGRSLPNRLVRWIGHRASRVSRNYTTSVKVASEERVRDKILKHAQNVYSAKPFDVLVSGHVHIAVDSVYDNGGHPIRSVNMGTWLKQPLVFDFSEQGGRLIPVEQFLTDS